MRTHRHPIVTTIVTDLNARGRYGIGKVVTMVTIDPGSTMCVCVRVCVHVLSQIHRHYRHFLAFCSVITRGWIGDDGGDDAVTIDSIVTWNTNYPRKCDILAKTVATEADEQVELARRLDAAGLVWFAIPNGGSRHVLEARNLVRQGVKAGVSDLLILTPAAGAPRGVAVEMKRAPPTGRLADVRPEQWLWLARFEVVGIKGVVGLGWRDAVRQLQQLGYEVQG